MTIFIGSTNPVKVQAVKTAANGKWPDIQIKGFDVASGIAEQPMTDEETKIGAENRAKAALAAGLSANPELENAQEALGMGLEGGVFINGDELWSTVWGCVVDKDGQSYFANGARMKVPQRIAELLLAGKEMGPVVEQLVGEQDVRRKQGMIGVVTNNFVSRTEEYAVIAKLALGVWYGRDWDAKLG